MGGYSELTKYQKEVFRADIRRLYEHLEGWGFRVLEMSIMIDPIKADQDEDQNTNTHKTKTKC